MKKKIFIRAYCHDNLGDDLFIDILTRRYSGARFNLIIKPQFGSALQHINNLNLIKENLAFRIINKLSRIVLNKNITIESIRNSSEYTVIVGGSMFWEKGKWKDSYDSYYNLLSRDTPLLILGANFGPYESQKFYKKYYEFFKNCYDICFRDSFSKNQFNELNNVRQASDIVFNYEIKPKYKKKQLTIIPMNMNLFPELKPFEKIYNEKIAEIYADALNEGYAINMISFCTDQGDLIAIKNIEKILYEKYNIEHINIFSYPKNNITEIIDIINYSELVLTTRFHGMILGWLCESKVFPIIYDKKMSNVMKESQYSGNSRYINEMTNLAFTEIKNNNYSLELQKLIKDSEKQFEKLDKLMEE